MATVIQLRADLARLMQGEAHTAWPDHLVEMKRGLDDELARLGASLSPMHPGVQDAELMRYFTLSGVSDPDQEAILVALRNLEGVTAAYVKPEAEPA
jgi:hypothetical protein